MGVGHETVFVAILGHNMDQPELSFDAFESNLLIKEDSLGFPAGPFPEVFDQGVVLKPGNEEDSGCHQGLIPVIVGVATVEGELANFGLGDALLRVYSLLDGRTRLGDLAARVRSPEARINLLRLTYLLVNTELARLS